MYVICQYYSHPDAPRAAEYEFCIRENLRNGHDLILFEEHPAPDDIRRAAARCIHSPERLTYAAALKWANEFLPPNSIVALLNLDIMLRFSHDAVEAHFRQYPYHFLCLSRLEYNPETQTAAHNPVFEKYQYMNSQDAWVFRTPTPHFVQADFPVGNCPGCDNAIAYRAADAGLIPLNLAGTFPIWHYDFVRSKNSLTGMTKDAGTQLLCPEMHGRLFLPRIKVGGSVDYSEIMIFAKGAAMETVEKSGYTPESDAKMTTYLACSIGLRFGHAHWDLRYLFGCMAINNSRFLRNTHISL